FLLTALSRSGLRREVHHAVSRAVPHRSRVRRRLAPPPRPLRPALTQPAQLRHTHGGPGPPLSGRQARSELARLPAPRLRPASSPPRRRRRHHGATAEDRARERRSNRRCTQINADPKRVVSFRPSPFICVYLRPSAVPLLARTASRNPGR